MEEQRGGSPNAILGFEDSSELGNKNMDIDMSMMALTNNVPATGTTFRQPFQGSANIVLPKDFGGQEPIRTSLVSKTSPAPAKITMNIPTFPSFFPRIQPVTVSPKKAIEPQQQQQQFAAVVTASKPMTASPAKPVLAPSTSPKVASPISQPLAQPKTPYLVYNPQISNTLQTVNVVTKPLMSIVTTPISVPPNQNLPASNPTSSAFKTIPTVSSKPLATVTSSAFHVQTSSTSHKTPTSSVVSKSMITPTQNPIAIPNVPPTLEPPVTSPLITVTMSPVDVQMPNSSHKIVTNTPITLPTGPVKIQTTNNLSSNTSSNPNNKVMMISPTAVTISSNPSMGVSNSRMLGGSQIPIGLTISKVPSIQHKDSKNLDPLLVPVVPREKEIPMQIDPFESISEFDSNSMNTCSLPGCDSFGSVFHFPRNRARRWCEILGIPHEGIPLKDLGGLRVCAGHFDPSEFIENSFGKELKLTAMPRIPQSQNPVVQQMLPQIARLEDNLQSLQSSLLSLVPPPPESSSHHLTFPSITSISPPSSSETLGIPGIPDLEQLMFLPPNISIPSTIRSNNMVMNTNLDTGKIATGESRMPLILNANRQAPAQNSGMQNIVVRHKTAANTAITQGFKTATNQIRLRGPGPKSQRKASLSSLNPVVPLGPYSRPSVKLRSNEVKADDLANLVMPSEDWSANIYSPLRNKTGKSIFTISETNLNSDYVEIVRKSITIQSSWAMKFSVMARDMSHFNLGLGVSDVSDVQAVLDNFDSLSLCNGLAEVSHILDSRRNSNLPIRTQVERFVDNVYRSSDCPLLLIGKSGSNIVDKVCNACLIVAQTLNSTTKITR